MLTIRLQRAGKRNNAHFRLVLAEKSNAVKKQVTEVLGSYNPHTKELVIKDNERLDYWIKDQHVELSATAHNLLATNNLIDDPKVKSFTIPKKEEEAKEEASEAPAAEKSEEAAESSEEAGASEEKSEDAPAEESESASEEAEPEETAEQPAEEATEEPAEEAKSDETPADDAKSEETAEEQPEN